MFTQHSTGSTILVSQCFRCSFATYFWRAYLEYSGSSPRNGSFRSTEKSSNTDTQTWWESQTPSFRDEIAALEGTQPQTRIQNSPPRSTLQKKSKVMKVKILSNSANWRSTAKGKWAKSASLGTERTHAAAHSVQTQILSDSCRLAWMKLELLLVWFRINNDFCGPKLLLLEELVWFNCFLRQL